LTMLLISLETSVVFARTYALRSDIAAARSLVALSALLEMYCATATLSIISTQEVCGTEKQVGGMCRMGSEVQNNLDNNLSIVEFRDPTSFLIHHTIFA
jgi:hypothetical protein